MKKGVIIFSSFFVFLFSIFVKFVSAYTRRSFSEAPFYIRDINFPDILGFLAREYALPGSIFEAPLWAILLTVLIMWAIIFILVERIHLFKDNKRLGLLVSVVLSIMIILVSPVVDWFLWVVFYIGAFIGVVFVALLIWVFWTWAHGTERDLTTGWREKLAKGAQKGVGHYKTRVEARSKKAEAARERKLFKRGIRLGRRELKQLENVKKQIEDLERITDPGVKDREKKRVIGALNGILRFNRLSTRVNHLVAPARASGDRVIRDKAKDLVSRTIYLRKIIKGIVNDINNDNLPGASDSIDEADDQLTVLLRNLEDLEERVRVGRYGP